MAAISAPQLPRVDQRTLVSAGLAALAAVMVLVLTRPAPAVNILVAAESIAPGQPLNESLVSVRSMPTGDGFVQGSSVGDLSGWTLLAGIEAGEPLLISHLVDPDSAASPAALAVSVPESHAALGGIGPSDRVDIYVTWPPVPGEAQVTELLAARVLVLEARVGSSVAGRNTVDLLFAVDDELAPLIARGQRVGELDLVRVAP